LSEDGLDAAQQMAFVGAVRKKYPLVAVSAGAFDDVADIKVKFVSFHNVNSNSRPLEAAFFISYSWL